MHFSSAVRVADASGLPQMQEDVHSPKQLKV
jgi:hypothetical protein